MKIVAEEHIPFVKEYFQNHAELILKPGREITANDVKDADVLLVRSVTKVNEALLKNSHVKYVASVTAGIDHLDTEWLTQANIAWDVAHGFNAPPVADYVVSVIAAMQRKKLLAQTGVKAAIIGVGNVGQLVENRFNLLDFKVSLTDPIRADQDDNFISTPIEEITDCDVITLHVPLIKHGEHPTYHLINRDFLSRQKPGCLLINASRGSVIDEKMLMLHGTHLQWCLDVFEHEPMIDKNIMQRAAIATPHIAGYSIQSKIRGIDQIYRCMLLRKIISASDASPITMPKQTLSFAGHQHHWQDIVLGIFNPIIMTAMMREKLLSTENHGPLFDEMRNQFNYRHEFGFTQIAGVQLDNLDIRMLSRFGLEVL